MKTDTVDRSDFIVYLKFGKEEGVTQQLQEGLGLTILAHFISLNSRGKDFVGFKCQTPSNANCREVKINSQLVFSF